MTEQRKLAAIMFTDIVGYSALMSKDEKRALEIIDQNRHIHKTAIKKFNGEFIKEIGDNTLASFHSALNAVSCAVSIQQELKNNPNLNLRIGIHIGDVIVKGDDLFGDCVNIASKIETLTDANSICISEHVYNYIHNIPGIEVELLGDKELKDVKQPVKIYEVLYDDFPEELITSFTSSPDYSISRLFFWQELKRRKVLKVATMYAAGAFGILEAFDILFPNIYVSSWVVIILSILVIVGFAVTIYLTWIYEVTSEGIKKTEPIGVITDQKGKSKQSNGPKRWFRASNIIIVALIMMVGTLLYPKIFSKDKFEDIKDDDGRISIAVMPFKNLSGDTLYNVWQEGLQNLLINTLTDSKELSVRQFKTMYSAIDKKNEINYASLTPSFASDLTLKLNTKTFILGSILKTGNKIRINAQLVNAETEEIYKTYQVDGDTEDDIFAIADSLSRNIKNFLEISIIIDEFGYTENYELTKTNSAEALRYYIRGMSSFINLDYSVAINWLKKAIETDSNFISAYFSLSMAYDNSGYAKEAIDWFNIAYSKRNGLPLLEKLELEWYKGSYYGTPNEQIIIIKQILEIEDQTVMYWYVLGLAYFELQQYSMVIEPLEKALEICNNLNIKDHWVWTYNLLGLAYHEIGDHVKENEVYQLGLSVLPDNVYLIREQAMCACSQGNSKIANEHFLKIRSLRTEKDQWTESLITSEIGEIYADAKLPDSAIHYHRLALKLDPSNPDFLYNLAWNFIDNDINIDEGMKLIDKALELEPENHLYLDAKGWGLFKQKKYNEALEMLNSAWENRPYYEPRVFQHLKEVENKLTL